LFKWETLKTGELGSPIQAPTGIGTGGQFAGAGRHNTRVPLPLATGSWFRKHQFRVRAKLGVGWASVSMC
jgi:hypothetical protein